MNLETRMNRGNSSEVHDGIENSIAIIGMSCRFPGANSCDEYWDVLANGEDCIIPLPVGRLEAIREIGTVKAEQNQNRVAGFLKCPIDEFDAKFFGISPREALFIDPQQRILLEVTWEGLEDAGIDPLSLAYTDTGVFVGIWQNEYSALIGNQNLSSSDRQHRYLGNAFSATASRMTYFLGLSGPHLGVESGCSSSLNAVHLGCKSLRLGESNLVIASGVNLVLNMEGPFGNKDSEVLSKDGRCKTFDADADGFVRADGCGVVILKRYEDAIREKHHILGVICGSAMNSDGAATSFGTPNGKSQELVIQSALKNARLEPSHVSYIEAHGTGTSVGDPIEVDAIGKIYSANRTTPLILGSVKSNIGHSEACAGIAGLIKVLLCLKHKAIPPNQNFKNLNPKINLDKIPANIPLQLTAWNNKKKIAGINSFSMTGTNVHLLVQEHNPENFIRTLSSKNEKHQMIGISAKSEEALFELISRYIKFLKENPDTHIEDIAFGLNSCRAQFEYCISVLAKNTSELIEKLQNVRFTKSKNMATEKLAFLFTGQGSQYTGMSMNLYANFPVFKKTMNECNDLYLKKLGKSLFDIISVEGELDQTIYVQPAIFCVQYSLLQLWISFGIKPYAVLGHSIGEFAAAVAAGVYTWQDAFSIVVARSQLVASIKRGRMLAIKTTEVDVRNAIEKFQELVITPGSNWVDVTAINSNDEIVVAGETDTIEKFQKFIETLGLKTQNILTTHANHSRAMDTIFEDFGNIVSDISTNMNNSSNTVYISGMMGEEMSLNNFNPKYWQNHLRNTVQFSRAVKTLWKIGVRSFIEIGSQPILLGLCMANFGQNISSSIFCPSLRKNVDDTTCFLTSLGKLYDSGMTIDWSNWFGPKNKEIAHYLPKYPFQKQKFWYTEEPTTELLPCIYLEGPLIHILLGKKFPLPFSHLTNFFNTLNANNQQPANKLKYISDHRIANKIIFPAAASLEIIMAAGREVIRVSGLQISYVVENFRIEIPMDLEKPAQIQTTCTTSNSVENSVDGSIKYSIEIYKYSDAETWKRHSSANFSVTTHVKSETALDLEEIKFSINSNFISVLYDSAKEIGIQFGTNFRSIIGAWSRTVADMVEVFTEIELPQDYTEYICHPILLDAMIQTYIFREVLATKSKTVKFILPTAIEKFTWCSKETTQHCFVRTSFTRSTQKDTRTVELFNSNGNLLAVIEGLEVLESSEKSFLRVLRSEQENLPEFYHEIWKQTPSFLDGCVSLEKKTKANGLESHLDNFLVKFRSTESMTNRILRQLGHACTQSLIRSIVECKWSLVVGETINTAKLRKNLPTSFVNTKFLEFCLKILEREGYVSRSDGDWKMKKTLPSVTELTDKIDSLITGITDSFGENLAEVQYAKQMTSHMTSVLSGKLTSLQLMFPEGDQPGALLFYSKSQIYVDMNDLIRSIMLDAVNELEIDQDSIIRILEVGGGTAATTIGIVEKLDLLQINYNYMFTDISPQFISDARKTFKKNSNMNFAILDLDKDPLTQNFSPEQFDFIIASQVLHATENLPQTLENLNALLRVNGKLIFSEQFEDVPLISLSFGLLDGWWKFTDFRKYGPISNVSKWNQLVEEAGFEEFQVTEVFSKSGGVISATKIKHHRQKFSSEDKKQPIWFVISNGSLLHQLITEKLELYGRKVKSILLNTESQTMEFQPYFDEMKTDTFLEGTLYIPYKTYSSISTCQEHMCQTILDLCQALVHQSALLVPKPRICVITTGLWYIGDAEIGNPNEATIFGILKCFANEYPEFPITMIDRNNLEEADVMEEYDVMQIFALLWTQQQSRDMFFSIRDKNRYVQRLLKYDRKKIGVSLPPTSRFTFVNPETKVFSDIAIAPTGKLNIIGDQVEIAVRATALNFRDLFVVLRPGGFFEDTQTYVGMDVAGVVISKGPYVQSINVGDEVFGFTEHGGLSSNIAVPESFLMRKPAAMTFTSAATIPCAFLTAYCCLVRIAKICNHDRVLIHVASGGVGLAAIQIAKHFGAEIYATAGSKRKRAYLRLLGLQHIYHSRNTKFGESILKDSAGTGVTIVLNSLTGPGFIEASLDACAKEAHFLEIGKLGVWKEEKVKKWRPDIKYSIIDLTNLEPVYGITLSSLIRNIEPYFTNEIFKSLPHSIFPLEHICQAFQYFQDAKQIGKVVIKMPFANIDRNLQTTLKHHQFDPTVTYLITGGLGGLGMEVAQWMTKSGAKYIVLAGRNPPNGHAQELINVWNSTGSSIVTIQTDVSDYTKCAELLSIIRKTLPPLRGIFHAAGVISDGILPNQNMQKFKAVLKPKVFGAWYLHELTLNDDIDYFVLFSSFACIIGSPGQSNHSAANRYLDSLAQYRIAMGLPATSINWGAWSDIGAVANMKLGQEAFIGFKTFTPKQGIASLDYILRHQINQITVVENLDLSVLKEYTHLGNYIAELQPAENYNTQKERPNDLTQLVHDIKESDKAGRQVRVEAYLETILRETLKIPKGEKINAHQTFTSYGVDSLMSMELRNCIQGLLGGKVTISLSIFREQSTLQTLSKHITELMALEYDKQDDEQTGTTQSIIHDWQLPEKIKPSTLGPTSDIGNRKASEISKILLTGATGYLGVHFIPELINRGVQVTCLIRAETQKIAEARLMSIIQKFKLTIDMTLVRIAVGDVTKENLGLHPEEYTYLAHEIEGIIHCAIKMNHIEGYKCLRDENVNSMLNMLEFAVAFRNKSFLHSSSMLAVNEFTKDGNPVEDFPAHENLGEDILQGYSLTKFVAEKLLAEASFRGIPITAVRYPVIVYNTTTGVMPVETDHLLKFLQACVRYRVFPDPGENVLAVMPVDIAVKISVEIFFNDAAERGVYNLINADSVSKKVILDVIHEVGFDADIVPFKEWRDKVFKFNNELYELKYLYEDVQPARMEEPSPRFVHLHPIAKKSESDGLQSLSEKFRRNYPGIEKTLISAKDMFRQMLLHVLLDNKE